ncbi:MAG: hypothetical protein JOY84_21775 [Curvibacter sp.]|nr:hypothetical protein [Curvibacter sp.]
MNLTDLGHVIREADAGASERQAALLLHGLAADDRIWALSQLPERQEQRMRELLDELRALGIPQDGRWVKEVVASTSDNESGPVTLPGSISDSEYFSKLAEPAVSVLVGLLRNEPDGLIARFLQVNAWSWRQNFMDQLPQPLRGRVAALLQQQSQIPMGGDCLKRALLGGVRAQLETRLAGVQAAGHKASPADGAPRREDQGTSLSRFLKRWSTSR